MKLRTFLIAIVGIALAYMAFLAVYQGLSMM